MYFHSSPGQICFIGVGAICVYLLIMAVVYGKKIFHFFGNPLSQPAILNAGEATNTSAWPSQELLPPLIDKPADHPTEQAGTYETTYEEESNDDFFEDEGGTTLLKEAERLVGKIQDIVNHVASSPANPEEVYTKIHAIVSQYGLFLDTEYYEAINNFIAVTVQRDCGLDFTVDEIAMLWQSQAA